MIKRWLRRWLGIEEIEQRLGWTSSFQPGYEIEVPPQTEETPKPGDVITFDKSHVRKGYSDGQVRRTP